MEMSRLYESFEEIFYRDDQTVSRRVVQRVDVVIDRNKANTQLGKNFLNILSRVNIIAAEAR